MKKYFLILLFPLTAFADELLNLELVCKYDVRDSMSYGDGVVSKNSWSGESVISIKEDTLYLDNDLFWFRKMKNEDWFSLTDREIIIVTNRKVTEESDIRRWNMQTKINRISGDFRYELYVDYKNGDNWMVLKDGECSKAKKRF